MGSVTNKQSRRGRLPADERQTREQAILDAALDELVAQGPDGLSMIGVARRASASKETLYSWFGSRDGLLQALIERNADQAAAAVRDALDRPAADHRPVLTAFAVGLLTLLTGPASVALNRAAMSSPSLAELLLHSGRHRVGPLVEAYLGELAQAGELPVPDPGRAFELLYGLLVQDVQIRVLLGESAPEPDDLADRARIAVDRFIVLLSTSS